MEWIAIIQHKKVEDMNENMYDKQALLLNLKHPLVMQQILNEFKWFTLQLLDYITKTDLLELS